MTGASKVGNLRLCQTWRSERRELATTGGKWLPWLKCLSCSVGFTSLFQASVFAHFDWFTGTGFSSNVRRELDERQFGW